MSLSLNLKLLSLNNANEKRTTIIQRNNLNNLFKTNREIKSSLKSKLIKDIKIENEDIINI